MVGVDMKSDGSLTIIKNINCLVNYPITRIAPDVEDLMQRSISAAGLSSKASNVLKTLDAFLHVTGVQLSFLMLSTNAFFVAARGFITALADQCVIPTQLQTLQVYMRSFVTVLDEMRKEVPLLPPLAVTDAETPEAYLAWQQMKLNLDPKALRYWNGWPVQGRKGKTGFIPIAGIWNSHGEDFAELIYEKYSQYSSKMLAPAHGDFNLFLQYLSENAKRWPLRTFQHPVEIKRLFIDFMLYNFTQALESGTSAQNRTRSYSKFIHAISETFIESGIWARPFAGQLPRPISKSLPGSHTNVKKNKDGIAVINKLITDIPLHITDTQAIDVIFSQIHADNKLVLAWAKLKMATALVGDLNCQDLASRGTVITGSIPDHRVFSQVADPENWCATYQQKGLGYLRNVKDKAFTNTLSSAIITHLGIPTTDVFFAFQMLLTYYHPCLTEAFFTHLELYDKNGNLSGFLETNPGYQLVGFKDRKTGQLSEQKVNLTEEQADWVRLIISLTTPMRNELKIEGNDSWRFLFLHSAGRLRAPSRPEPLKLNLRTIDWQQRMINEFMSVGNLKEEQARQFIIRLSVTAFRASAGVEVYLKTHSVEEMARALGHTRYESSLLSSYLPEPILAFFQTRWVRLFQRGIICQAMKGSPRILEATRFRDMDELHEFLKNHALRDIPEHLQNPDHVVNATASSMYIENGDKDVDQVLVSVDAGILTALLSLTAAVAAAKPNVRLCGKAIYWSQFTDVVVKDIEAGYNSDFHEHLVVARKHADASHMEDLIYATTA